MILSYTIKYILSNRNTHLITLAIFYYIIFAPSSHAATNIVINEIAWAGSTASANDEWVELYNPTDYTVNMGGWHLKSSGGSPNITLQGIVPAGGYFLLERTDDQSVPNITANQIYSGSLGNDGEKLTLIDTHDVVQDEMDASSGWPAGDAKTKQTMERDLNLAGWHTGPSNGTPLEKNTAAALVTPTTKKDEISALLNTETNNESKPRDNLQQQNLLANIGTNNPQEFSNKLEDHSQQSPLNSATIIFIIITLLIAFISVLMYRYRRVQEIMK